MKKNQYQFIIMIVCLFHLNIVTSQKNYNYSNYKFPNVSVRGLVGNLNLSSSHNNNEFDILDTKKRINLNLDLEGGYFVFKNSETQQKIDNWNIDFKHNNYDNRFNNIDKRTFLSIDKQQINRRYDKVGKSFLGFKQSFWEYDHAINYSYQKNNVLTKIQEENSTLQSLGLNILLKRGYGRIEPMSDVFLAHFLMDDLLSEGLIVEKFNEEQLFELAQLMSTVRNQRVFDFRRAKIYQLTEIANWMEKNGIPQNIKSFTTLNDNWQSVFIRQRQHGKRISLGINPWVDVVNKDEGFNSYKNTNKGITILAEYSKKMALSQYVQADLYGSVSFDYQKIKTYDKSWLASVKLGYSHSYQPTSRTTYSIGIQSIANVLSFDQFAVNMNLPISASHFINNRARVNFNFYINYQQNRNNILSYNRYNYFSIENQYYAENIPDGYFGLTTSDYYFVSASLNFNYFIF